MTTRDLPHDAPAVLDLEAQRPSLPARAWRALVYMVRAALGLDVKLATLDRLVLEQTILPAYAARSDIRRVLFVGCAAFTRHYESIFARHEYSTIDQDPACRRYGSARHIVARLEDLDRHVAAESLDLIVCNGVFGWGLDRRDDCEAAFAACARALRPNGEFMLGWNDVASHRPFVPEAVEALARFRPIEFPPLGAHRYLTATRHRHTFDFYART